MASMRGAAASGVSCGATQRNARGSSGPSAYLKPLSPHSLPHVGNQSAGTRAQSAGKAWAASARVPHLVAGFGVPKQAVAGASRQNVVVRVWNLLSCAQTQDKRFQHGAATTDGQFACA